MGITSTKNDDGTTNPWPYYGCTTGTSHATPIVAGVCALMKSINPCLTPAQAQSIIKATADPIADAYLYPGQLGAGRINAFEAVKLAGTKSYQNTTLYGNRVVSAGFGINLNSITIASNSNIKLTARKEVDINGTFYVPLGSSFEITIDSNAVNDCFIIVNET
jgi:serine protease